MVANTSNSLGSPSRRKPIELTLKDIHSSRRDEMLRWPLQLDVGTNAAEALLDRVQKGLKQDGQTAKDAMVELFSGLHSLRTDSSPHIWKEIVKHTISHPVLDLIHQDPFTARSFHKPRGYAGDAVLIDYIYTGNPRPAGNEEISPLGQMIFDFTTGAPASAGVRTRRDLMASVIDQTCALIEQPQILSVACGHLREATLSRSIKLGHSGRFIALDQDPQSLDVVKDQSSSHGIVPVCSSIKSLFRGEIADEKFDLIYSTGLYDYLDDRIATRLTARLFEMLNPGGRLIVANFLPDIWCAGFMETFMGWTLIYRNAEQIDALASTIPGDELASRRTYIEKNANIVLLDVMRR